MEQIMEMLKTMQEKADANRKIDNEEMTKKMDANQATLTKMEAERKSDLEDLKSMMERMMNTNQTGVKLKELTDTVEKTHRE
jgi:Tfp pilus assembly protein PilN